MPQPARWLQEKAKAIRYKVAPISAPKRDFHLCLKTPDYRPYIPGSELKGAIRTAVLTKMLDSDASKLNQLAQNIGRRQLRDLCQTTEQNLLRGGQKDAHYDLFRGISISGSEPIPTERLRIYAAKRLGMSKDVTVFTEAIAPDSETTITLSIAKPDRWMKEMGLTDKEGWLDWSKLAQALYEHANDVLDFIAQKFPQVSQRAKGLKSQNKPDSPLVCVGWGQGFLSVTMTNPLRKKHPNAYEALRKAMAQVIRQYGRTKPGNFPKTIWVALDSSNQPADLFGWLKLEVSESAN